MHHNLMRLSTFVVLRSLAFADGELKFSKSSCCWFLVDIILFVCKERFLRLYKLEPLKG
jgi:hypothetical protein